MSRKGNCYDNAVVESFFSTLKNELMHEQDFQTREEAQTVVFEFIEGSTIDSGSIRRSAMSVRCSLKPHVCRNSVSMKSGLAQGSFLDCLSHFPAPGIARW
jgi:transposase InsO family protein